jgi:hypothetical protein
MSKALILGTAALIFSAAGASAQVYTTPDYRYGDPVADLAPPDEGYAAPAPPSAYAAPPIYAAPVYTPPPVYVVPAPVYAAPVVSGYYAAPVVSPPPVVSRPIGQYMPTRQVTGVATGIGGTATVTGGGAKHIGENSGSALGQPQPGRASRSGPTQLLTPDEKERGHALMFGS